VPNLSVLDQRELGRDFRAFHEALTGVVRQRPDIVLVGEMRDLDTMQATLSVAETGHLVLSTLHTGDAVQAIPRLVESFPPTQHGLIRNQLASVLLAIVNQRLVKGVNGKLQAAYEVFVNTPAMANIIRDGHTEQLYGLMEIDGKHGNRTMNAALEELVTRHKVAPRAIEPFIVQRESRSEGAKGRRH
jgi:twitching motility protein PilT